MPSILRTPDSCFEFISDFPYQPRYIEDLKSTLGARVHYVDEGPRDAKHTFLCLHGEPTWAYLYRKMIPVFVGQGHRVVAPDLIGFGRSDKFAAKKDYSFVQHRSMLLEFIERMNLRNVTLVVQDWGGLLGLTLPMDMPGRFSRLLVMNTALATGDLGFNLPFLLWWTWARLSPDINAGMVVKLAEPKLSPAEKAAYNAPFPEKKYKVCAHIFPDLVPVSYKNPGAEISRRARDWWRNDWQGQTFMAIGKRDKILGEKAMRPLSRIIRNCPEPVIFDAGHFVQEQGDIVARQALKYFAEIS